jgi:hypothetical protein
MRGRRSDYFIDLFDTDQGSEGAKSEKAALELPQWIAQERRDVQQERDLYQREMALRGRGGLSLTEEQVASKEAALAKQIREETRLLLQLKAKRGQWGSPAEKQETGYGGQEAGPETPKKSSGPTANPTGPGTAEAVPHIGPASTNHTGDPSGPATSGSPTSGPASFQGSGALSEQDAVPTNGKTNGKTGDETATDGAAIAGKIENGSNEPC